MAHWVACMAWSDGRTAWVGQSAFPRERKGQLRSAARSGRGGDLGKALRATDLGGEWYYQWCSEAEAGPLADLWKERLRSAGLRVIG
jgi:hypothetical protein